MSSKEIGIEDARKQLGDLVTSAQQGADIILTRNGKPAARIIPYTQELTVQLTAAQQRLLAAINDGQVTYAPATRGGHTWQRYDNETRTYKKVTGSTMNGFVYKDLVKAPTPRASGTAKLTAAGQAALAN